MRKRTQARVFALQVLYQMDITGDNSDESLNKFWQTAENPVEDQIKNFTGELVKGVADNKGEIDKKIIEFATNWQIERMAVIDRNILRISCYELIFRNDIPPKVSINEAVELAKKYSGVEAGKFVNGILDKINPEKKQ